jgi:L-lactate dehydrogenase
MPVSTVLRDFHGLDGVALSVPSIVSARGAVPIRATAFSTRELAQLRESADALTTVAHSLRV